MRQKSPYERVFQGFGRPQDALVELAKVDGVDAKQRTVNISFLSRGGGQINVPIFSDRGNYSLPRPGDVAFCFVDKSDRVFVLGFRDADVEQANQSLDLVEAVPGEVLLYPRETRQRLHLKSNGEIHLLTERDEGIEIIPHERTTIKSDLIESIVFAGKMMFGTVRRRILGGLPVMPAPDQPITQASGLPEQEFQVHVSYFPDAPRKAARFAFGTGLYNDVGLPEMSPFGGLLRGILEVSNFAGIPLANIAIDESGSVQLFSLQDTKILSLLVEVLAPQVAIRSADISLGLVPIDYAILGNLFLTIFNTHTHTCPQTPAGVQVTAPPNIPAPPGAVLSRSVRLGIV